MDWQTRLKPKVAKMLAERLTRLEHPGLPADKTEFLRGEIYALRAVIAAASEAPGND